MRLTTTRYRKLLTNPNGYGKPQSYYHLKQNLVTGKDVTAVLANIYKPGEKLMADFAGKKLNYVDSETGENYQGGGVCRLHTLQQLYLCNMCTFAEDKGLPVCHKDVPGTSGRCTSYTDSGNLKSAVISNDRHEPKLRQDS